MSEDKKSILNDLIRSRYSGGPTVDYSGFKIRPVDKDEIRTHCQVCGSYKGDISPILILINGKEFESFKCKKCDNHGVVPSNKKPLADIYKWLAALKNNIECFHLE